MVLFELVGQSENRPTHRAMEVSNGKRYYDFLEAVVEASLAAEGPFLSQTVLKVLNYHAIACLHPYAENTGPTPCAWDITNHRSILTAPAYCTSGAGGEDAAEALDSGSMPRSEKSAASTHGRR